ncbi:hypothetical protein F400_gp130 [Bacillus phage BCD7]|uniref:Uncharacterized protein n=1 Tax=Bacillus phage BCD7 TaxID=1136534 RepID=J9PUE6_9CAUD|nr:hypothetical protein F400_gp130 [Bacillus phage BCD7]AEZ50577.1 hypothetical protein BCD7_0130 [Bacillus phage BCD7]
MPVTEGDIVLLENRLIPNNYRLYKVEKLDFEKDRKMPFVAHISQAEGKRNKVIKVPATAIITMDDFKRRAEELK